MDALSNYFNHKNKEVYYDINISFHDRNSPTFKDQLVGSAWGNKIGLGVGKTFYRKNIGTRLKVFIVPSTSNTIYESSPKYLRIFINFLNLTTFAYDYERHNKNHNLSLIPSFHLYDYCKKYNCVLYY